MSWWTTAAIGSIVLAIVLLVDRPLDWFPGRRTHRAGRGRNYGGHGTTTVDTGLLARAVKDATAGNDEILGASVSS